MKLIPEKEIEETATDHSIKTYLTCATHDLYHDIDVFAAGVSFAEEKLTPLMEEFAEWISYNVFEFSGGDGIIQTDSGWETMNTKQLLEQFIKTKQK